MMLGGEGRDASEPAPGRGPGEGDLDYDAVWRDVYGDLQEIGPAHHHMRRLMRRLTREISYGSVLDVGCGFGHNLRLLVNGRDGVRVAGIDVSDVALEHVRKEWGPDFHKLDIQAGHLPASFDLVCCSLVLEHVEDDIRSLGHMREMTGKYLLVTTIGGNLARYRPWEEQMGHVRNYRRGELEEKLRATGFHPAKVMYWGFPFYTPIVRTLQNRMVARRTLSTPFRGMAWFLRYLYYLNTSHRGDLLVALARV